MIGATVIGATVIFGFAALVIVANAIDHLVRHLAARVSLPKLPRAIALSSFPELVAAHLTSEDVKPLCIHCRLPVGSYSHALCSPPIVDALRVTPRPPRTTIASGGTTTRR